MKRKWTDGEIDAALREDKDSLMPSSGFLDGVMAEVRTEASALPAIPFPWTRALPGLAGAAFVFVLVFIGAVSFVWKTIAMRSDRVAQWPTYSVAVAAFLEQPAILWTIASVLLAFFYLGLTRRLTSGR